jgi:hypothetical protein
MGHLTRAAFQRETGKSRAEVDRLLAAGLPHTVVGNGRGSEIRIDRAKAMAWLAGRTLDGKAEGGGRAQSPPEPEFPPAIKAILDETSTDLERGYALALMLAVYETPRVVGGMAIQAGVGLTMTQAYECVAGRDARDAARPVRGRGQGRGGAVRVRRAGVAGDHLPGRVRPARLAEGGGERRRAGLAPAAVHPGVGRRRGRRWPRRLT